MWERTHSSQGARVFMARPRVAGLVTLTWCGGWAHGLMLDFSLLAVVLPQSLSYMPRPIVLPCFHPLPPPAPSHMGQRRRHHDWGRWEEDRLRGIARAHPVPILRGWARVLTVAVDGVGRWGKIVDAACILYAVCMLFPGALDLPALLVGAFEYLVSVGATRAAASISYGGTGLAVAPGVVQAALRWRFGAATLHGGRRPPRRRPLHGGRLGGTFS